jgi:cobalt-zinc-cadmium efflux system protein
MLMDAVPSHIHLGEVRDCLLGIDGVADIHDLHVWAMSTSETSLTAHLVTRDDTASASILRAVESALHDQFGITHSTVQLEPQDVAVECDQGKPGHL